MENDVPQQNPKPEREKPFPIRLGRLRPKLQEEADAKGLTLTEYLLFLLESRNESRESEKDSEILQLQTEITELKVERIQLIESVERKNNLLKTAAAKLKDWGVSTKFIPTEETNA